MPGPADAERERLATVARAQALIRAGRAAEAIPLLDRATAASPVQPAGWVALGVARSMLGDHARAVEATARAVQLAPRVAAVQLAHGDVLRMAGDNAGARRAYAAAAALAPGDADALNKLAGSERIDRDFEAAHRHLVQALAAAPMHPYARVNLATLALERHDAAEARRRLADVLRDATLPADAAAESAATLAMLDEHAALQPSIEAADAADAPAPIEAALRARGDARAVDRTMIEALERTIARAAAEPSVDASFAAGTPASAAWPAIEAHHNFRRLGGRDAIANTVERVRRRDEDPSFGEVLAYARAVAARREALAPADGIAWEASLRWLHRRLNRAHPEFWPGQVKPVNNRLPDAPRTPRTAPVEVAGTLRTVLARIDAALPPGAWRACLRFVAIIEIHPFYDGNGRLARYVVNRSLEATGRFPSLRPDNDDAALPAKLRAVRDHHDVRPLAEWLAAGSHYAAGLDRAWGER